MSAMNNPETKQAAERLRSCFTMGFEMDAADLETILDALAAMETELSDRDSRLAALQEDRDQETSRILAISCPGHADLITQLAAARRSAEDALTSFIVQSAATYSHGQWGGTDVAKDLLQSANITRAELNVHCRDDLINKRLAKLLKKSATAEGLSAKDRAVGGDV